VAAGTPPLRLADRGGGGGHAEVLARGRAVRCSLDQHMADEAAALREGAEVAFFPPVTGG
jgi:molybdopterin synthase sulfur carrier subunit